VAQAEGQVEAQRHLVDKLHNGNRPQEKAQARANVDSAQAELAKARQQFDRLKKLSLVRLGDGSEVRGVSQEDLDNAKAAFDVAEAKLAVNQKALDLMLAGFRKEEIAQAESQLRVNEAQLALLRQQLADTELLAPTDAIVRTRLMEEGEMASPQKPVFSLAIVDPKWVRAYVSETDQGKLHPKMAAFVTVDSFPNRRFDGWVGFISPVAEFTPKTVQTEELRTSLVYEVRVFVKDPGDELRLGMPATVHLPNQKVGSAADEGGR
jgi:HlyD family secretion protein